MRILVLFTLMAIYADAQDSKLPSPAKATGLVLSATPVLNDENHKDAVEAILKAVGLSSTGTIWYVGQIQPTFALEGFCQCGESVLEYRTTHLSNQTAAVVWYNPSSKKLHYLYSQKAPNKDDELITKKGEPGNASDKNTR